MSTDSANVSTETAAAAIERELAGWDALLAEIGEDRMAEPGPMGDESFKDLAAHLAFWAGLALAGMEAELAGQPGPALPWPSELTGYDAINTWVRDQHADRPLADVLAASRDAYLRFADAVRALPEADLNAPGRFSRLNGDALGQAIVSGRVFSHWHELHEPDVRRWLADLD